MTVAKKSTTQETIAPISGPLWLSDAEVFRALRLARSASMPRLPIEQTQPAQAAKYAFEVVV